MTAIEERLLNPKPGGAIWAAREFGVDLSLVLERLRRTPQERIEDLQAVMIGLEAIRGAAGRVRDQAQGSASRPGSK